jgi:hypothetical protein
MLFRNKIIYLWNQSISYSEKNQFILLLDIKFRKKEKNVKLNNLVGLNFLLLFVPRAPKLNKNSVGPLTGVKMTAADIG